MSEIESAIALGKAMLDYHHKYDLDKDSSMWVNLKDDAGDLWCFTLEYKKQDKQW